MGPYVIDQSKRQEYFLFLVFFIVISFALGYFFGYQNGQSEAHSQQLDAKQTEAAANALIKDKKPITDLNAGALPLVNNTSNKQAAAKKTKDIKKTAKSKPKVKPKPKPKAKPKPKPKPKPKARPKPKPKPKVIKPKAESKPVAPKQTNEAPKQTKKETKKSVPVSTAKPEPSTKDASELKPADKILDKAKQASVTASGAAVVNNSTAQAVSVTTDKKDELIESKQATDTATDALAKVEQRSYSIQVAMFNRKPNAEKYVNELQQIGFIAFLASFTSSGGAEKYNVRLGPYFQRDQANENLALFKQSYSTSAYILTSK